MKKIKKGEITGVKAIYSAILFRDIRAQPYIPLASDTRCHPKNLANTRRNCRQDINGVKGDDCLLDTLPAHHDASFHGYLGLLMLLRYHFLSR
jgi:hypothetical protein